MTTTVYWSSAYQTNPEFNTSILYVDPNSLLAEWNTKRDKDARPKGYMNCPAVTDMAARTLVFRSNNDFGVSINDDKSLEKYNMDWVMEHEPTLENQYTITADMSWYFFSDDPEMQMTITAPYHTRTQHLQYGHIMGGRFNIGSWFRPVNLEFELWEDVSEFHVKETEAFMYANFHTDDKVVFKRFEINEKLYSYAGAMSNTNLWSPRKKLIQRYAQFGKTSLRSKILGEIENCLV